MESYLGRYVICDGDKPRSWITQCEFIFKINIAICQYNFVLYKHSETIVSFFLEYTENSSWFTNVLNCPSLCHMIILHTKLKLCKFNLGVQSNSQAKLNRNCSSIFKRTMKEAITNCMLSEGMEDIDMRNITVTEGTRLLRK